MKIVSSSPEAPKGFLAALGSFMLLLILIASPSAQAFAQDTAPTLGTAQSFAVLGGSTVTNTGTTVVTGDLGTSPGTAVTGFPPGTVAGGSIHAADAAALQAQKDAATAYNALASETCTTTYAVPTDLGGQTLRPGVYCFASSAALTGTLTLDGSSDPSAVFIFKTGSTLITASNATVALTNGATACNVFWQVGSSATLGTQTQFVGSILALASITIDTSAMVSGRALASTGAVTLDSDTVSVPSCAGPPSNTPPVLSKSFTPPTIAAGGSSTFTVTMSNANATAASITSPLTDIFPSGLTVSGAATTNTGGSLTAPIGAATLSLTGGTIPANGTATISVLVTAPVAGTYVNSLPSGALHTSNGNSLSPAVATLSVTPATNPTLVPPVLGKSFSPANITLGSLSTLILTLSNSNPVIDKLTAPLTDNLPIGMTSTGNVSTTCGGTVTAPKGSTTVTLTGGTIPIDGSCTVSTTVATDCGCNYHNSIAAGALQTDNGNNAAAAVATLTVTKATTSGVPSASKFFYPAEIKPGAATTLTIVLANPNTTAAQLTAAFTDNLPSGMVIYGLPKNVSSNTCGGALTATKGSNQVTLTGGQIPASSTCALTVYVTAANAGTYVNSLVAGALKTNMGTNTSGYKASLVVSTSAGAGTMLSQSFSPNVIANDGITTLTITLQNPHPTAATLTAPLVDYLPNNVVVYGSVSNTCGGVVSAVKGNSTISLSGGVIPINSSCKISVAVTAPCGNYFNYLATGKLITSNGNNQEPAGAALTVTAVN